MQTKRYSTGALTGALFTFAALSFGQAVTIEQEGFEGATAPLHSDSGLITAGTRFYLSHSDFWTATTGATPAIATAGEGIGTPSYNGQEGSRYWAGEDMDANGTGNTHDVVWGPIPISGFENLAFNARFAADGVSGGLPRYDAGEGMEVAWSIDGGAFTTALAFKAQNAGSDSNIRKDADLNGFGDGGQPILGPAFVSDGFPIPGTGANLTIRVRGISSSSSEEFAFDDLEITGDVAISNLAPTASALSAPSVGETEIGDTSYMFTLTYNDDSAVDVSTIGNADVTISGPGGSLTVTGASFAPAGDGTPRTATYTATPPGGSWDSADNGTYTVSVAANQVGDDGAPQLFVATGSVGTFMVNATNTAPVVASVAAPGVGASEQGDTSYSFTLTYTDVGGVDASSIGSADVTVTGPGGAVPVASGSTSDPDGSPLTATYSFTPPGGSWDPADDGTYTIAIVASQVDDVNGASVAAGAAGTFEVDSTCIIRESFEGPTAPLHSDTGLITSTEHFHSSDSDFWIATTGAVPAIATAGEAAGSPSYNGPGRGPLLGGRGPRPCRRRYGYGASGADPDQRL